MADYDDYALWWMNIKDKTPLNNGNCCPAHYLPHKIPDGDPITDEPCHFHNNWLRMAHHRCFCTLLRCPHYEKMMEGYRNRKRIPLDLRGTIDQ